MKCQCPGDPDDPVPCPREVTQEDLLCDLCRERNCPNCAYEWRVIVDNLHREYRAWRTGGR